MKIMSRNLMLEVKTHRERLSSPRHQQHHKNTQQYKPPENYAGGRTRTTPPKRMSSSCREKASDIHTTTDPFYEIW